MPDNSQTPQQDSEITIQSLFDQLEEWNAGVVKIALRDENDKLFRAVIAIDGIEECEEIINAIEAIEEKWHKE